MNKRLLVNLVISLVLHLLVISIPISFPEVSSPAPETLTVDLRTTLPASPSPDKSPEKNQSRPADRKTAEKPPQEKEQQEDPVKKEEPENNAEVEARSEPELQEVETSPQKEPVKKSEKSPVEPTGKDSLLQREPMFQSDNRPTGFESGSKSSKAVTISDTFKKFTVSRRPVKSQPGNKLEPVAAPKNDKTDRKNTILPDLSVPGSNASLFPEQKKSQVRLRVAAPGRGHNKQAGKDRKLLRNPLPAIPGWLAKTGQNVRLVVSYTIVPDGSVESVKILTSSGYPDLDSLVVNKLEKWKYEEGNKSEERKLEIYFKLVA